MGRAVALEERAVVRLRAHSSRLLGPAVALLVAAPLTGALVARADGGLRWLVVAVAAALLARVVLWPFLRWWTTTYELTTRRVSLRWGVVARHGRDVPWRHVADVALDRTVLQRLTGRGTVVLVARGAGADGGSGEVALADVPQPERLWRAAAALAEEAGGAWDGGPAGGPDDEDDRG